MKNILAVRYINDKYIHLTKDKVYEVVEYRDGFPTLKIKNDLGIVDTYFWYYSSRPYMKNFIDATFEYNRNKVINEILK